MNKFKVILFFSSCLLFSCSQDNEETIETIVSISNFEISVDENPIPNQSLGIVNATTNQGNMAFSILEQTPNNAFVINISTGELTISDNTLFDFETNPIIIGTVKVENGTVMKIANIRINLNDVDELSLQERLNNGETPFEIYQSDSTLLESLYGLNYRGGIIFYLDINNGNGLLAAQINQTSTNYEIMDWGCENNSISSAENALIWSGQSNTTSIINNCSSSGIAALICDSLQLNGYSDWFLPSKDELNLMYENLHLNGFGNFKEDVTVNIGNAIHHTIYYWSSTQSSNYGNMAWVQTFSDGSQYDLEVGIKSFKNMVRAVRMF